jgi:hypothetical protein
VLEAAPLRARMTLRIDRASAIVRGPCCVAPPTIGCVSTVRLGRESLDVRGQLVLVQHNALIGFQERRPLSL